MRKLFVFLLLVPVPCLAVCLNPFGCESQTQAECVKVAASAKTEAAAKAMIIECRRLPRVTQGQCRTSEKLWARHLASRGGVEWDWPDLATKDECRRVFPTTFSPALWVTSAYCETNAARLAQAAIEVDPTSFRSVRLDQARKKDSELAKLDDRQVIEVLQSVYYRDKSQAELAAGVFIDAPPEPLAVAAECKKLAARAAPK
jgi:hypothetical protein